MSPLEVAAAAASEPIGEERLRRRYRDVIGALLAAAAFGTLVALVGGRAFSNKVLLDAALSLTIGAGMLAGVVIADVRRHRGVEVPAISETPEEAPHVAPNDVATTDVVESSAAPEGELATAATELFPDAGRAGGRANWLPPLSDVLASLKRRLSTIDTLEKIRSVTAIVGLVAATLILTAKSFPAALAWPATVATAVAYLAAATLAAGIARYLRDVDGDELPEAAGLTQGARALAWILLIAAASVGAQWAHQLNILRALHFAVWGIDVAVCYALLATKPSSSPELIRFPVALGPLTMLGARANVFAGVLDAAERQLGIDLRSTWAITVVRRSLEPLIVSLVLVGWLSTSFTVVGLEEQGITERLGVPVSNDLLAPGLHLHWPFPIDRVYRIPVQRAQSIGIGHEGEEAPGPENVLWSVKHAANEFTLVLGNGRDLITVDAAVQFRVTDPYAWQYRSQNPEAALKALAYRAVMRNTVNRTLTDALSENVTTLTQTMRAMVQHDADSLGLGVSIIGFTVGGMHPPVAVAPAYEGVVSAEIRKATAVVDAQVFRNQALPGAEAAAVVATNGAKADAAETLGRAAGEAWSFRALESQYRASPAEYMFRRRLETMEKGLTNRPFTIVDARFLRDGGELWVVP